MKQRIKLLEQEGEMTVVEEKVQKYLLVNGITQVFFANLIGISPANVAAMFNGKRRMKADELIKFCEHYGLSFDYFRNKNLQGGE